MIKLMIIDERNWLNNVVLGSLRKENYICYGNPALFWTSIINTSTLGLNSCRFTEAKSKVEQNQKSLEHNSREKTQLECSRYVHKYFCFDFTEKSSNISTRCSWKLTTYWQKLVHSCTIFKSLQLKHDSATARYDFSFERCWGSIRARTKPH